MKKKVVNTILLGALSSFPMFGGCSSAETPVIPGAEQTGGEVQSATGRCVD